MTKFLSLITIFILAEQSLAFNTTRAEDHVADAAATSFTLDGPVDVLDLFTGEASPLNLATRWMSNTFGYSCRELCKDHFAGNETVTRILSGACGAACGSVKYSMKKLAEGTFAKTTPLLGALNNGLYGASEGTTGPVDQTLKIFLIESAEDLFGAAMAAGTLWIGWKNGKDTLKGSAGTAVKVGLSLHFVYKNLVELISKTIKSSATALITNTTQPEGDL